MVAEVKTLYETNFRDVAATLRVIADNVDAGKHGVVDFAALVIAAETGTEVFRFGRDSTPSNTACLMHEGLTLMSRSVVRRGRE